MLQSKVGQAVPPVSFQTRVNDEWQVVTSDELFKGKTVVLFALPGAFTPTCSSTHLPRYNELHSTFVEHGVDDIICLSVNDTFVMNSWSAAQSAEKITFLPDGNGDFSEKMGMLVDKTAIGFGKRSWRYSMLVKDGIIEKMFIEPEVEGDPFEVSDADTMLAYIAPDAVNKAEVSIITKPDCPFCIKAKALLTEKGYRYEELTLGEQVSISGLRAMSGRDTVPQIYIDGQHVGGSEDLVAYFA